MYPNPTTIPRCFLCFILCSFFSRGLNYTAAYALSSSLHEKEKTSWKIEFIEDIGDTSVPPCGCQYRIVVDVAAAADRMLIAISSNRFNWLYYEQLNLFIWARWMHAIMNINDGNGKTIKFAFVFVDQFKNIDNKIICLVDLRARATLLKTHFECAARRIFQINNEH